MQASWILRHRIPILTFTFFIVLFAGLGLGRLTFSPDYREFFDPNDPYFKAYEDLNRFYTYQDNILFVLSSKSEQVFNREFLSILDEFTLDTRYIPNFIRVDSLSNFPHTTADGDTLNIRPLAHNPKGLSDEQLILAKKLSSTDPQLVHRLVSSNGKALGVEVTIYFPGWKENEREETAQFALQLAQRYRSQYPDLKLHIGGSVLFGRALKQAAQDDFKSFFPLMYLAVSLIAWWILRSLKATLALMTVVFFADVISAGIAGWLFFPITAVSVQAPNMILIIGIADGIHILTTFFYYFDRGSSRDEAILESLNINSRPVFLTSVTTSVGFICFNFNSSPPYQVMGIVVAIGIVSAYFLSIFYLPAILSTLTIEPRGIRADRHKTMLGLADWVIKNKDVVYWSFLGFLALSLYQLPKLHLDEKITEYIHPRYSFRSDTDFITQNFTGIWTLEYDMQSGKNRGIIQPEYLDQVNRFASWYAQQPETVFVSNFAETIKRFHRLMHGDDPRYFKLPKDYKLIGQYLTIYEMSVPPGVDLGTQIRPDDSATRFVAVLKNISTKEILDLNLKSEKWLSQNIPPNTAQIGTSPPFLFAHLAKSNLHSIIPGTVVALCTITILLTVFFKSIRFGFIALLANIVPPVLGFGLWAIFSSKMGIAVSLITLTSLGLVFSDTIHLICYYLAFRKHKNFFASIAIRNSFEVVGVALGSTTVTLFIGFAMLIFSGFTINAHLGALTAMIVLIALIADLLFLPVLILKLEYRK